MANTRGGVGVGALGAWRIAGLAVLAAGVALGCDSGGTDGAAAHVHIGCEAGAGCAEDLTVTGTCAQDRPHLCFCGADGAAATPGPDCIANVVKPYAPYTRALCCP